MAKALLLGSDVVIKATKVKGVYSADPVHDPSAEFIPAITFQEVVTRELGVMDAPAVALCKENDLPIMVFDIGPADAIVHAVVDGAVGTVVGAIETRLADETPAAS